jgi:hypothetical protein
MFYYRNGAEVEAAPGGVIDTHDADRDDGAVNIYIKLRTRNRAYALGESIIITANDFYEIAMACYFFATDLGSKLPTLPPAAI